MHICVQYMYIYMVGDINYIFNKIDILLKYDLCVPFPTENYIVPACVKK